MIVSKYTFLLPAYKRVYLYDALQSIISQTFTDFKVIVSDDCSPEDLKSVVDKFKDARLFYRRNEKNIGGKNLVRHWNLLVDLCDTDYLIMASDDDIYAPTFLEEVNKRVEEHPEIDIIKVRSQFINAEGEVTKREHALDEIMSQLEFMADFYVTNHVTCVGNYVYKTKRLKELGGFKFYPYAWGTDVMTAIIMAEHGIACVTSILFNFRMSGVNISSGVSNLVAEREKILATLDYDKDICNLLKNMPQSKSLVEQNLYHSYMDGHREYIFTQLLYASYLFSLKEIHKLVSQYHAYFPTRYCKYLMYKKWLYSIIKGK